MSGVLILGDGFARRGFWGKRQSEEAKHFLLSVGVYTDGSIVQKMNGKESLHIALMESIPLGPDDMASVQHGIAQN
jgi:hypothetical protein